MKLILGFFNLGIPEMIILVSIIVLVFFVINIVRKNNKNDTSKSIQIKDVSKEEKIENQEAKTIFVPKKKPIRKSQS
jgi:uncharacterized membrane protein